MQNVEMIGSLQDERILACQQVRRMWDKAPLRGLSFRVHFSGGVNGVLVVMLVQCDLSSSLHSGTVVSSLTGWTLQHVNHLHRRGQQGS